MTRTSAGLRLALALAAGASPLVLAAQDPQVVAEAGVQDNELYTVEELDNLLAPVALYPDPILAQLLVAATYPEQVALAQRYVQTYGTAGVDEQAWDVSVKAIARYEPVLNMLAERPNWATAVGRAYALQPGDVMASVQSLRRMARAQGNLVTTDQQRVEVEREAIRIVPAQPQVIYVPVYDPYVVYYRPINYVSVRTPYWSFGIAYPIGGWLAYDVDWGTRVVYYHGWRPRGGHRHWYVDSRPYVTLSGIWVSPYRTTVIINRTIVRRHVRYDGFDRYNYVHRRTSWDRPRMPGRGVYVDRGKPGTPDRYGIPTRRDAYPDKVGKNDGGLVPRVGRAPLPDRDDRPGNGGRPGAGNGGRGNGGRAGGDDLRASGDRITPVRVGGNRRPLYGGEDISSDRIKGGTVARRETSAGVGNGAGNGGGNGNGSWNPRGADRVASGNSDRFGDRDRVSVPRASSERAAPRATPRGNAPRNDAPRFERAEPTYTPRGEQRSVPRASAEPRYERSAPRAERSVPRASAEPRMERSVPRAERSAPRVERSAPRMERSAPRSEPRSSAPRQSAPRAERGNGGGKGPKGG